MPSTLLPIPHRLQRSDGDCLAACAAMMLDHLGVPADGVYINDPDFEQAPQRVPRADFELAWPEFDYRYAVIWRLERAGMGHTRNM